MMRTMLVQCPEEHRRLRGGILVSLREQQGVRFPCILRKGDGEEITISGDDMTGAAKVIAMNSKDNDAGFLNGTDASEAFCDPAQ